MNLPNLVFKCGRSTSWSAVKLNEVDAVKYGKWGQGRAACFVGVGVNQPFSTGGDSGAVIFTNEGHPVTQILAGSGLGLEDLIEAIPIGVIMDDIVESLDLQSLDIIC